jgi:hypothetical protein
MDKGQAIKYIQQQIDKIDIDKFTIGKDRDKDFNVWKKLMQECIISIYGENSIQYTNIRMISYVLRLGRTYSVIDHNIERRKLGIKEAKLLLEGYIENIKNYGLPNSTNIYSDNKQQFEQPQVINNIHNHNNQTQEVNISIIVQNIFEGLSASEKEELKKVLQQYYEDKNRENLIQSLQSIGKGVLENILANFITNPPLLGKMIDILQ